MTWWSSVAAPPAWAWLWKRRRVASRWRCWRAHDFAKGTSSRATKLVHGGVRYLAQGDISLVREALHERRVLLDNAPHLAAPLAFVMPFLSRLGAALLRRRLAGLRPAGRRCRTGPHALSGSRRNGGCAAWRAGSRPSRQCSIFGTDSSTTPAWPLHSRARQCVTAPWWPTIARLSISCRSGDAWPASNASMSSRAAASWSGHGAVVNAAGVWVDAIRGMDAQAAGRPACPWCRRARACISSSTGSSCRAITRSWSLEPGTAGCCSPFPGWAR